MLRAAALLAQAIAVLLLLGAGAGAAAAERVWVVQRNAGTLAVIDPLAPALLGVVDPRDGALGEKVAAGEGGVWVTFFEGQVHRIDPLTLAVAATLRTATHARSISAGNGAVWVGNGDLRRLTRIDPRTNTVTGHVVTEFAVYDVAMTRTAVWVATAQGRIHRLAPNGQAIAATITTDGEPNALAGEGDVLWASDLYAGRVLRVDARGGVVAVDIGLQTGEAPDLAVGLGSVWVATAENNAVVRIAEDSNEVLAVIDVGGWVDDLAVGASAVWAVLPDDAAVVRIDPATNTVSGRVHVDGFPSAVAVSR